MRFKILFSTFTASMIFLANAGYTQGDTPGNTKIENIGLNQTINCKSEPVLIGVTITNWVEGFEYEWKSGERDSIISVKPNETTNYILQITNEALNFHALRSFTVEVFNEPVTLSATDLVVDKFTCAGSPQILEVNVLSGLPPFSFEWDNGGKENGIEINPISSGQFKVKVTDACESVAFETINVTVETHDAIVVPANEIVNFDCDGDVLTLQPDLSEVSGGVGYGYMFTYTDWNSGKNIGITVDAKDHSVYEAVITDACGLDHPKTQIELIRNPIVVPQATKILACAGEEIDITKSDSDRFYYWDGHEMNTTYPISVNESENYSLTYLDQCGTKHAVKREIEVNTPKAEFDYDAHAYANRVNLTAQQSEGVQEYAWFNQDNLVGTGPDVEVEFESGTSNEIELVVTNSNGCKNSSTRLVYLRDNISIPSAFSPNGDGRNDVFSIELDEEFVQFNIRIFDRWGQLIYENNDQYFAWEGDKSMSGMLNTYVYKISGVSVTGQIIKRDGTLTIVN